MDPPIKAETCTYILTQQTKDGIRDVLKCNARLFLSWSKFQSLNDEEKQYVQIRMADEVGTDLKYTLDMGLDKIRNELMQRWATRDEHIKKTHPMAGEKFPLHEIVGDNAAFRSEVKDRVTRLREALQRSGRENASAYQTSFMREADNQSISEQPMLGEHQASFEAKVGAYSLTEPVSLASYIRQQNQRHSSGRSGGEEYELNPTDYAHEEMKNTMGSDWVESSGSSGSSGWTIDTYEPHGISIGPLDADRQLNIQEDRDPERKPTLKERLVNKLNQGREYVREKGGKLRDAVKQSKVGVVGYNMTPASRRRLADVRSNHRQRTQQAFNLRLRNPRIKNEEIVEVNTEAREEETPLLGSSYHNIEGPEEPQRTLPSWLPSPEASGQSFDNISLPGSLSPPPPIRSHITEPPTLRRRSMSSSVDTRSSSPRWVQSRLPSPHLSRHHLPLPRRMVVVRTFQRARS